MSRGRATIVIRMPAELNDGLKAIASRQGENVATLVRSLAREAVERGGFIGISVRGNEGVRPLGRGDK